MNDLVIESNRIFYVASVMGRKFSSSIWYKDVDFNQLKTEIGGDALERIVTYIVAFDLNKYGSLNIDIIDLGTWGRYIDTDFSKLWTEIFINVWAQWRYENNLANTKPPKLVTLKRDSYIATKLNKNNGKVLTFFGGGKDSLVSVNLLDDAGVKFDVVQYSSTIYGNRSSQSVDELLYSSSNNEVLQREFAVYDDFLDSPLLDYESVDKPDVATLAAAETPFSLFAALPIILTFGYRGLALGHEKSANYPNLFWDEENKPVNHQWGKSIDAQIMLSSFIKDFMYNDLDYFSTLMPLSDPAIFAVLAQNDWNKTKKTQSCNVVKPWCRRCPKCVYVWLFYLAFLDAELVKTEVFANENLFTIPENQILLEQLLGFRDHTPFECVGQPEEARLALYLCYKKGIRNEFVDEMIQKIEIEDILKTVELQLRVDVSLLERSALPIMLEKHFLNGLSVHVDEVRKNILENLNG